MPTFGAAAAIVDDVGVFAGAMCAFSVDVPRLRIGTHLIIGNLGVFSRLAPSQPTLEVKRGPEQREANHKQ